MKKSLLLYIILSACIFLTILFILPSVQAQIQDQDGDGIPDQLTEENIKNQTNNTLAQFQYLSQEWKKILLEKPIIAATDSFLRKIDLLFLVFFGQSYDLTFAFFLLFVLWLIVFLKAEETLEYIGLPKLYSYLGGLGTAMILAQIGLLRIIITGLVYILYSSDSTFRKVIFFVVIFLVLVLIYVTWSVINKKMKERKKKKLEEKAERKEKKLIKITEAVEEGMKEGEK